MATLNLMNYRENKDWQKANETIANMVSYVRNRIGELKRDDRFPRRIDVAKIKEVNTTYRGRGTQWLAIDKFDGLCVSEHYVDGSTHASQISPREEDKYRYNSYPETTIAIALFCIDHWEEVKSRLDEEIAKFNTKLDSDRRKLESFCIEGDAKKNEGEGGDKKAEEEVDYKTISKVAHDSLDKFLKNAMVHNDEMLSEDLKTLLKCLIEALPISK